MSVKDVTSRLLSMIITSVPLQSCPRLGRIAAMRHPAIFGRQAGHIPSAEFVDWTRDIVDPDDRRAPVQPAAACA